jgi:hypothetical protein
MGAVRVVVVVLVFVVSLAALAASSVLALWEGTDELTARDQLRAAAAELAATAREPAGGLPSDHAGSVLSEPDNRRLAELARRVLANYPGTEGGFYFTRSDQLATRRARSPARWPGGAGDSSRLTAALCSLTRWANWASTCKRSCSASSRAGRSSESAARRH